MVTTRARKVTTCPATNGLSANDSLLVTANVAGSVNNYNITATNLFANSNVPHVTLGNNAMSTANLIIRSVTAPANSSSNGVQGQIVWDATHIYICIANNSWVRTGLTTF